MTTKERLIKLFEENKEKYLSGEEIAEELEVSRAAVWKAVKSLQAEGYPIDAVTNKGYCLSSSSDMLSAQGIEKYLGKECEKLKIEVKPVVESTNTLVVGKAVAGAPEGTVVIATSQTKGKGRVGRSFFSPEDTGLYLSLLLRPTSVPAEQAVRVTTMAAVAVCQAIEEVTAQSPGIKWVNDIFLNGKKVCGILTEGAISMETGYLDYAVLGVGINVYEPSEGFPEEIKDIAGAVLKERDDDVKNRLAAAFLNHFMEMYNAGMQENYVEKYRSYSIVVGNEVMVLPGGKSEPKPAFAFGIDDECHLLVRFKDGREEALSNGEISIRLAR